MEATPETPKPQPQTWREKFAFLKTKRFFQILLLGQFLSLCNTAATVTSVELAEFNMPTAQTFLNYVCLMIVYNSYTIYKRGLMGYLRQIMKRGLWYFLLAIIDVEGNYTVVKAFQYTSLLSIILLDAWVIVIVMTLGFFFLKTRYHWSQIAGVAVCMVGLALLIKSDIMSDKDYPAQNRILGDVLVVIGATCYGISNTMEEFFARKHPLYEVIGMIGLFGTIISGIQCSVLERAQIENFVGTASPLAIGMLFAFTFAMFSLYTCAPILFRLSSATFFNLSLLTSDFYGLIFGLVLFKVNNNSLYPGAYVLVMVGLIIYYVWPAPEPKIGTFDQEAALKDQLETEGRYRNPAARLEEARGNPNDHVTLPVNKADQ